MKAGRAPIALLLGVLGVAVFLPVRNDEFVTFDDVTYVVENPSLAAGLTPESVGRAFTTTSHLVSWMPLTAISHQLDRTLFGLEPAGHHLMSLGLHVASTLLLFLALVRMTGAAGPSAFVAAVFAVHPLHVESVAWVVERKDTLSAFFFMLTLLAYARYAERPSPQRYAWVALALALGLLAKPMLVTLPFVLLLLDYWPLGRLRRDPARTLPEPTLLRRALVEKVPFFALVVGVCVATLVLQQSVGALVLNEAAPLPLRLMNALASYVFYLEKALWPSGLCVLYPLIPPPASAALAAGVLLTGLTALAIRLAPSRPYVLVGWLWYLGTLVPVIGLIQVGWQGRADRYTYLPLIGLAIVVAWGGFELAGRERRRRAALAAAGTCAVLGLAVVARMQLAHWRDSHTLYQRALAVTRGNYYIHYALGELLLSEGRPFEAELQFTAAQRLQPGWLQPQIGLADAALARGELDDAIRRYALARQLEPKSATAAASHGLALLQRGHPAEARRALEQALSLEADLESLRPVQRAALHVGLARVLEAEGETVAAALHYRRALEFDPGNEGAQRGLAGTREPLPATESSASGASRGRRETGPAQGRGDRKAEPGPRGILEREGAY